MSDVNPFPNPDWVGRNALAEAAILCAVVPCILDESEVPLKTIAPTVGKKWPYLVVVLVTVPAVPSYTLYLGPTGDIVAVLVLLSSVSCKKPLLVQGAYVAAVWAPIQAAPDKCKDKELGANPCLYLALFTLIT